MLASLGNRSAVAEVLGVRFSGFFAWLAWRAVYWAKLPGVARKVRVLLDWIFDLIFPRDIARIRNIRPTGVHMAHFEPGETIIRKHEIGRELFAVQSGEVEVFHPAANGRPEQQVTILRRGEVFGEKALLDDVRRTADVRALTAVDVLVVPRADFAALVGQFAVLGDYFENAHGRALRREAARVSGRPTEGSLTAECTHAAQWSSNHVNTAIATVSTIAIVNPQPFAGGGPLGC